jgi:hypothetical protein
MLDHMSEITTLTLVRQQLEELAFLRLRSELGAELEETYRALCVQERELLAKNGTGSRGHSDPGRRPR